MASDSLQFIFYRIVINTVGNQRDYKRAEAGLAKKNGSLKKLFLTNTGKKYTEKENIKIYLKKFGAPFTVMAGFWQ